MIIDNLWHDELAHARPTMLCIHLVDNIYVRPHSSACCAYVYRYCIVLYCVVLYCMVLYCIVLEKKSDYAKTGTGLDSPTPIHSHNDLIAFVRWNLRQGGEERLLYESGHSYNGRLKLYQAM